MYRVICLIMANLPVWNITKVWSMLPSHCCLLSRYGQPLYRRSPVGDAEGLATHQS